ncbi:unnamed protein product [Brachionus calyciflorus]|uniref:Uncharacterized protein n=1 Tax=Brachionus calyciflorus TaxID=104777 RepID=A0A813YZ61_9BILA|nr:unnamed protein product [Brachionus calyciflorus]
MKFNISKPKNKDSNLPTNGKGFQMASHDLKDSDKDSKSANFLFSIKTKTKMKRSHHQKIHTKSLNPSVFQDTNGIVENTNLKNDNKNVNKVSLKKIGTSFANLFKPTKRSGIRTNQNIQIDNEKIFFPIPIKFTETTRKNQSPKLTVRDVGDSNMEMNPMAFRLNPSKSVTSLHENLVQSRRNQPSMGLKAYNLKVNSNRFDQFSTDDNNIENMQKIPKKKSMMFRKYSHNLPIDLASAKSDSNLKRDFKPDDDLYDCLINYESNRLVNDIAQNLKAMSNEIRLNSENDTIECEKNLVPFLDQTRDTFIQPLMSSTVTDLNSDFELSENSKLQLTPLRFGSRMKKLHSFSKMQADIDY